MRPPVGLHPHSINSPHPTPRGGSRSARGRGGGVPSPLLPSRESYLEEVTAGVPDLKSPPVAGREGGTWTPRGGAGAQSGRGSPAGRGWTGRDPEATAAGGHRALEAGRQEAERACQAGRSAGRGALGCGRTACRGSGLQEIALGVARGGGSQPGAP